MIAYLVEHNANHGGAFRHQPASPTQCWTKPTPAMADFYNAARPEEIVFGNNMTTLTLHISRSMSRPGIRATRSWSPAWTTTPTSPPGCWRRKTAAAGCAGWISTRGWHPEPGRVGSRRWKRKPRLVAVGYASNALGTINPVKRSSRWRTPPGRWCTSTPCSTPRTGRSTCKTLGCDFLVCFVV